MEKETMTIPPTTDPVGIGSRLPTSDMQPLKDWWKPWELTNTHISNENVANLAHEPHGEPRNHMEALVA